MMSGTRSLANLAVFAVAVLFIGASGRVSAEQPHDAINIGDADLGGVVTGAHGPEAGVWVIAETTELPTRYVKIVVTDDTERNPALGANGGKSQALPEKKEFSSGQGDPKSRRMRELNAQAPHDRRGLFGP